MSLRVSQPLWSTSAHAAPNWSRLYPVFGARPFTASVSSTVSALSCAPSGACPIISAVDCCSSAVCDGSGSGVAVAEGELVVEGCALELEIESTGEQPKTVRSKAPADSEAARVRQVEAIAGSSLLYAIYEAKTINMVRPPCPCTRDVSHMVTKLPYCEHIANSQGLSDRISLTRVP